MQKWLKELFNYLTLNCCTHTADAAIIIVIVLRLDVQKIQLRVYSPGLRSIKKKKHPTNYSTCYQLTVITPLPFWKKPFSSSTSGSTTFSDICRKRWAKFYLKSPFVNQQSRYCTSNDVIGVQQAGPGSHPGGILVSSLACSGSSHQALIIPVWQNQHEDDRKSLIRDAWLYLLVTAVAVIISMCEMQRLAESFYLNSLQHYFTRIHTVGM